MFVRKPKTRLLASFLKSEMHVNVSNTYAEVKWKVAEKERFWIKQNLVPTLAELIVRSLLGLSKRENDNSSLEEILERKWFTIWKDPRMQFVSDDLREWLLLRGMALQPSIGERTLGLFVEILKAVSGISS
jgi:hypothetical protein